jgi:formate hydrogenlyase subunit 4
MTPTTVRGGSFFVAVARAIAEAGGDDVAVVAQMLQVLFVLAFAPFLKGYMDRLTARGMRRIGPPVTQPYRNLWKWLHKETVRSRYATGISEWVPVLYFSAPLIVALLIPVLTTFPLPLAFMGDMLGGGMILAAAGLLLLWAGFETGSPYTGIAFSRVRLIGTLGEPLVIMGLFTAAEVGRATIPYIVNQAWAVAGFWGPTHILLLVAWLLLILAESGRLPVDNPDSQQELSLIDPNRTFEASGLDLALYEWGGWMKLTVLAIILVNVLGSPVGLAASLHPASLAVAVAVTALKLLVVGTIVTLIALSFAKLRLMRIAEYLAFSVALATLAALAWALA